MTGLPGVCRSCRQPVWWNGWSWVDRRYRNSLTVEHRCQKAVERTWNARSVTMERDEYSVSIAHNAQRPVSRLYSERRGACVREYRPNA